MPILPWRYMSELVCRSFPRVAGALAEDETGCGKALLPAGRPFPQKKAGVPPP